MAPTLRRRRLRELLVGAARPALPADLLSAVSGSRVGARGGGAVAAWWRRVARSVARAWRWGAAVGAMGRARRRGSVQPPPPFLFERAAALVPHRLARCKED